MNKLKLTVKPESIEEVTSFIENELENYSCSHSVSMLIMVAIDEMYSNIIKYSGADKAEITIVKKEKMLHIVLSDNGKPFNPLEKEDPDVKLPIDKRTIGGVGIFIVKNSMDDIKYKFEKGWNVLTLSLRMEG